MTKSYDLNTCFVFPFTSPKISLFLLSEIPHMKKLSKHEHIHQICTKCIVKCTQNCIDKIYFFILSILFVHVKQKQKYEVYSKDLKYSSFLLNMKKIKEKNERKWFSLECTLRKLRTHVAASAFTPLLFFNVPSLTQNATKCSC